MGHQMTHCGNRPFDNSSLCCLRNVFHFFIPKSLKSPPWGTGKKRKEKEKERSEAAGGGGEGGGCCREDRKALDGEDGKFGECGPIFNSSCQATDEQQGRKGWRARLRSHWVTAPHADLPKDGRFTGH